MSTETVRRDTDGSVFEIRRELARLAMERHKADVRAEALQEHLKEALAFIDGAIRANVLLSSEVHAAPWYVEAKKASEART